MRISTGIGVVSILKLLVLDGNSILNRAFYGIKLLSTKEGLFTNGIYGFMTMMEKVKEETRPDGIAVAFDLRAPCLLYTSGMQRQMKLFGRNILPGQRVLQFIPVVYLDAPVGIND